MPELEAKEDSQAHGIAAVSTTWFNEKRNWRTG